MYFYSLFKLAVIELLRQLSVEHQNYFMQLNNLMFIDRFVINCFIMEIKINALGNSQYSKLQEMQIDCKFI